MKLYKFFAAGLILAAVLFANDIRNSTEEKISAVFPGDINFEMSKIEIPVDIKSAIEVEVKQRFFADELYVWKITQGTSVKGYAVLDNVYGKSLPITFLVIFDNEFNILNSSIIKYREPYGGGVASETWNNQFIGRDSSSSYKVGEEINGISGATISVKSVSTGIRKLALLIPKISDKL